MRKQIVPSGAAAAKATSVWLNLEELADVQVTSEDPQYPIESVFLLENARPWRAAATGRQTIRLEFTNPQSVQRVHLEFSEAAIERTQEFVLSYRTDESTATREIVRQQWNFSPRGSRFEIEDYVVGVANVTALELTIDPDRGQDRAVATLDRFMVG